jgi:hypothetical protein
LKLSAHFLSRGRYWTSGEEIPDELVPPHFAAKYGIHETVEPDTAEPIGPTTGTHVKRGAAFKRIGDPDVTVEPAEPTYRRVGKAFIPA